MHSPLPVHLLCFAIASHLLIFKRFAVLDFGLAVILLVGLPGVFLAGASKLGVLELGLRVVFECYIQYYSFLALSIISYRLSPFHRLHSFPGPLICRVTNLWIAYIAFTGRHHQYLSELHRKYGDFVRVGPEELSIGTVDGIVDVLGIGGLPKGKFYDSIKNKEGPKSLNVLPPEEHAKRRRLWNRGMNSESLTEYEIMITRRATQLMERLSKDDGPINIIKWLDYFSFDFVGDMAFGGGFELLEAGCDKEGIVQIMEIFMVAGFTIAHVPWLGQAIGYIPFTSGPMQKLRDFGTRIATARVEEGSSKKDLWYHLTDEAGLEKEKPLKEEAVSDGTLAINAGADTTARAIAFLLFLLLDDPIHMVRVRAEINSVFIKGENVLNTSKYTSLTYLEACINETLRLYPPVPTNGTRKVQEGSGGRVVAGRFIPEGTEILIAPYVLHRNPKYFAPHTDDFWPDRWLVSTSTTGVIGEEKVLNMNAFIPFSYGPQNCAGRNLARLEIRMIICLLLSQFEVSLAENFDKAAWLDSFCDYFVMRATKPLDVVLKKL
ncbi:high nitrogen upregulated cytochrome P450 monooxygenase 1 [Schizopora paradoxa]|uniref:High nitrogen upregulated cytochrome P450 monooxygenase 1 n=1 Tax=Schizopora paradoxa TaxID=27342 RepID=A0A0H2SM97_9AGAM|nr:high nitrogen upregulated cytochrome P450 monooxygenase 1 [Schizopora paradoxa]